MFTMFHLNHIQGKVYTSQCTDSVRTLIFVESQKSPGSLVLNTKRKLSPLFDRKNKFLLACVGYVNILNLLPQTL